MQHRVRECILGSDSNSSLLIVLLFYLIFSSSVLNTWQCAQNYLGNNSVRYVNLRGGTKGYKLDPQCTNPALFAAHSPQYPEHPNNIPVYHKATSPRGKLPCGFLYSLTDHPFPVSELQGLSQCGADKVFLQGHPGTAGIPGVPGTHGLPGAKGDTGPQGPPGEKMSI